MGQRSKVLRRWVTKFCLLLITSLLLGAIRLGLWLLPFQRLLRVVQIIQQIMQRTDQRTDQQTNQPQISGAISIRYLVWAVNTVCHYTPGHIKCLARALTTQILMTWQGYSAELRIGVAKGTDGNLEAHAWIEYQGRVVIGNLDDLSRFMPLPSLEGVSL